MNPGLWMRTESRKIVISDKESHWRYVLAEREIYTFVITDNFHDLVICC